MVGVGAFSWEEEVAELEGSVGDWRPDLVNKSAEAHSFDLTCNNLREGATRARKLLHK